MDSTDSPETTVNSKKSRIFLFSAVFIALVLVGVGGYVLGNKNQSPLSSPTPKNVTQNQFPLATKTNTPLSTPVEITNWKIYTNKEIGFEFKYPSAFDSFGPLTEKYQESEVGFNYCLKPIKETGLRFFNLVYAGGGGCFTDTFGVSANSFDYERGSMGSFLDFHGYEKEGPDIKIRRYSALSDPIPQNFYKIITNPNGVEIVKIYGQPSDPNNPLRTDNPGEGFIAAFVNTKSKNYPGIAFIANLKTTATEEVFDQILSSIKILPAQETILPYINYDYKYKTYVANDFFAISYPKEYYFSENKVSGIDVNISITNTPSQDQLISDNLLQISINVYDSNPNYFEQRKNDFAGKDGIREKVSFGGKEVEKISKYQGNWVDYYYLKGNKIFEISTSVQGKRVTETNLKQSLNQILSTFKFL